MSTPPPQSGSTTTQNGGGPSPELLTQITDQLLIDAPYWTESYWFADIALPATFVLASIAVAVIVALILHAIIYRLLRLASRTKRAIVIGAIKDRTRKPARWLLIFLSIRFVFPAISDSVSWGLIIPIPHALAILILAAITWLIINAIEAIEDWIAATYKTDVEDNLTARRVQTQSRVLIRTLQILVGVLGAAAILMTFPGVKQFGASMLASAGVAGLILGLAARPTVGNLIAGLQIAITQPIRLDDVVIVEGEWGRIEEITSTYVVVRIWDERRLIVPLTFFIEQPFQNWTRTTAQLLGTIFLYTDYTVPLDSMREELKRLVANNPNWDKRVCLIQITNASESTMEVRALVSSHASGALWDLRCAIREGLIDWIQRNHPHALPRTRVEMKSRDASTPSTPSPAQRLEDTTGGAGSLHEAEDAQSTKDEQPDHSPPGGEDDRPSP